MELSRIAEIAAHLVGVRPEQAAGALATLGLSEAEWARAYGSIAHPPGEPRFAAGYRALVQKALAARLGGVPEWSFDALVDANVIARRGGSMAEVVAASGLSSEAHFFLASYVLTDRIESEPKIAGLFEARVR